MSRSGTNSTTELLDRPGSLEVPELVEDLEERALACVVKLLAPRIAETPEAGGAGSRGALEEDRRWRWLLSSPACPPALWVWPAGLAWATVAVWADRLTSGPSAVGGTLGVTAGMCGLAATGVAVRRAARSRPWLLLAWRCVFTHRCLDAAGLTAAAYAAADVALPGDAVGQYRHTAARTVSTRELLPGDLVFWSATAGRGTGAAEAVCHVGIYVDHGEVMDVAAPRGKVLVRRLDQVRPLAGDDWRYDTPAAVLYRATRPPTTRSAAMGERRRPQ
jgi:hypothetical protein